MNLLSIAIINVYSIAVLAIILFHMFQNDETESLQQRLYEYILKATMILLFFDIISRFDGKPGTYFEVINQVGNLLIFLASPILPFLWLLYVHFNVYQNEKNTKKLAGIMAVIVVLNWGIVFLTQFTGWYYTIDENNIYHRGPFFYIAADLVIVILLISFVLVLINRRKIKKEHFFALLFFSIPPFILMLLQVKYYGISLMLNSIVLSLLIVFLNVQNRNIYMDYLTGINNRKKLDHYLKRKISKSTGEKTFSAIMIDLDNFKAINDTFGHDEGDRALQKFVELLKISLPMRSFIARYGGDEFCIVLNIYKETELEEVVTNLKYFFEKYNETNAGLYRVNFSMGYSIYPHHLHLKPEEFQKQIDLLLYENKLKAKEKIENESLDAVNSF